jgi:hypothetical protein
MIRDDYASVFPPDPSRSDVRDLLAFHVAREAENVVIKHAFYLHVFADDAIALDKKLDVYRANLPAVLSRFGIRDR